MPDPRLYLQDDLAAGENVDLDEGQARYLTQVLRLGPGKSARLFNGRDGEWQGVIARADRRATTLTVGEQLRAQTTTPDLRLLFSPLKRQATDWLVEKATELGVRALAPVIAKRTVAETVRLDRLTSIAREAAEQTERLDVPEVGEARRLDAVLDRWPGSLPLIYADEAGDDQGKPWGGSAGRGAPLAEALKGVKAESLALLIGPEGGFDPVERTMLRGLPFVVPVSLGPRILRAETAAVAALAVIQAGWGDWR